MKGVLLAAGRGKRLRPLTDSIPKPLIELSGHPILEWALTGLRDAGIDDIAIITGYRGDQIRDYFQNGSRWNLSLHYFVQKEQSGTANAVLPAADFLNDEPFFLGYGDIFVPPQNYLKMHDIFQQSAQDSILAVRAVDDPSAAGVVLIENGCLSGIIEKPAPGTAPGNLINAGLMILQPEIFQHIRHVTPSVRGEYELTDALVGLAQKSAVHIYRITDYWSDIGTLNKLETATDWIKSHGVTLADQTCA